MIKKHIQEKRGKKQKGEISIFLIKKLPNIFWASSMGRQSHTYKKGPEISRQAGLYQSISKPNLVSEEETTIRGQGCDIIIYEGYHNRDIEVSKFSTGPLGVKIIIGTNCTVPCFIEITMHLIDDWTNLHVD